MRYMHFPTLGMSISHPKGTVLYGFYQLLTNPNTLSFSNSNPDAKLKILKKVVPTIKKVLPVAQKVVNIATIIAS
jgi:hypothetical protein